MKKQRMGLLVAGAAILVLVLSACDPGKASVVTSDTTTFAQAGAIAMIPGGGEYVVDPVACVIRKIDAHGVTTTVAGTGTCGFSGDEGPATAAKIAPGDDLFAAATGHVALDASGNIYFTDSGNARIRKVDTSGTITTIAGDGSGKGLFAIGTDVCSGTTAYAGGITVTPDGTVYVACPYGIGKVLPDGTLQQVLAANPSALTSDANGILYFGDYYNERIQSFDPATHTVTTVSDFSTTLGSGSDQAVATDLAVGADGTLFAAFGPITFIDGCTIDYCAYYYTTDLHIVTRIENGVPVRIAGTGDPDPATGVQTGYGRDLSLTPYGIAVSGAGALLISSGHTVYRIDDAAKAEPSSGSDCSDAFHSGADFSGQDLSGKKLTRCNLSGIDFTGANLSGADLTHDFISGSNFTGANLAGANLSNSTIWSDVLTNADLTDVDLTNSDLSSSTLTGATFTGANLTNARGTTLVGTPATLPAGFAVVASTLVGPGVDISNRNLDDVDFSGVNLSGANLSGTHLLRTSFVGTNLSGANLTSANLQLTNFAGADLTGATLNYVSGDPMQVNRSADFTNADLSNAHIDQSTSMIGPVFTGANVSGANLTGLRSSGPSLLTSGDITGTPQLSSAMRLANGYLVGAYTDLAGVDLSNVDLSDVNISGADFTGATLANANLSGVVASNTILVDADLTDTDLDGASLTSTDLSGADLTGASAVGIFSNTLTGTAATALPTGISYPHNSTAFLVGPGAKLNSDDLTGLDLSGIDLSGADLSYAKLVSADVTGTNFANSVLTRLKSSNLTGLAVGLPTPWVQRSGFLIGPWASLTSFTLDGVDFSGTDLTSVRFDDSTLSNLDLSGVDLSSVSLAGATLTNVNLSGANLSGAELGYAVLTNVNLHGANVQSAEFHWASLSGVRADDVVGTVNSLPSNWSQRGALLVGPGANLSGDDLSGLDLSGLTFGGVDLTGVNFANADLTGTGLVGANLTNADFAGANLTSASLLYATVTGAQFATANLTHIYGVQVVGTPASLPTNWTLISQYLVGPGAGLQNTDLSGFDLSGVDISGATLTGVDLTGTKLDGATLDGVVSSGIKGTPASLPTGWKLIGGFLIGKGAVAPGVNLGFQNLSDMDLSGANLSGASLSYTNLTGANLTGTNLQGANLNRLNARQITGTPINLPAGWTARSGFLFGPTANLIGANLTGLDLSGLTLTGTRLDSALLGGANLTGTTFATSTGTPTGGSSATYANTTCPDATVATSPATCVGHGFAG
jgi:uncharacterized protein YjbI with pentapeptide repeats